MGMSIRVFTVPQGGVHRTTGKMRTYPTFADFVQDWEDPTPLQDNTPESKKRLPYFVGGVVEGKRHDSNVRERTLLTLDIEAPKGSKAVPPQPKEVQDTLDALGLEGWVYTTASHTKASPRYRVVLPLKKPIAPSELQAATVQAAAVLGVEQCCAPESWVASQPMYLPAKVGKATPLSLRTSGKPFAASSKPTKDAPADIPDAPLDPVLRALQRAGLYLHADANHRGKHYIRCPWADEHGTVNDTQTVYFEAHHDGNPKPAVKCLDTEPDEDGVPHLTYRSLVNWLRDEGHLPATEENADTEAELEDPDAFWESTAIGHMLDTEPKPLEFAIDKLAPLGKVTVLAGPGGVSKSSLALRLLVAAATGSTFGPFAAPKAIRCMYLSYEDDAQTFHQRLKVMHADMDSSVDGLLYDMGLVRKNLRIAPIADHPARWTLMRKDGHTPQATERLRWLANLLKTQRVRLLVIDPLAYTHHLEESSPGEIAQFMQTLGRVAAEAQCAILLLHHMHKTAMWATLDEIHQGSLRGASSFADNARSVAVLVSLTQKDAPTFGLPATHDVATRYAVFKHVKHNFSASLGMHVFERHGLLLRTTALAPLAPEELAQAKAQQQAADRELRREVTAQKLLSYLHQQPGHEARASLITNHVFSRNGDTYGVKDWCIEQGYLTVEEAVNGKPKPYRLTAKGVAYLTE